MGSIGILSKFCSVSRGNSMLMSPKFSGFFFFFAFPKMAYACVSDVCPINIFVVSGTARV